jgi:hypothetical protein
MKTPKGAGMQRILFTREARYGICTICLQRKLLYYINGVHYCSKCKRQLLPIKPRKQRRKRRGV